MASAGDAGGFEDRAAGRGAAGDLSVVEERYLAVGAQVYEQGSFFFIDKAAGRDGGIYVRSDEGAEAVRVVYAVFRKAEQAVRYERVVRKANGIPARVQVEHGGVACDDGLYDVGFLKAALLKGVLFEVFYRFRDKAVQHGELSVVHALLYPAYYVRGQRALRVFYGYRGEDLACSKIHYLEDHRGGAYVDRYAVAAPLFEAEVRHLAVGLDLAEYDLFGKVEICALLHIGLAGEYFLAFQISAALAAGAVARAGHGRHEAIGFKKISQTRAAAERDLGDIGLNMYL